jgi:hypothetical protein
MDAIIAFAANKLEISEKTLKEAFLEYAKENPKFSSSKAEELYKELDDKDDVIPSGDGFKITVDDVKKAMGEKTSKKEASQFASKTAEKEASAAGLTASDFPMDERTGRELKSKVRQISVEDVRAKSGTKHGEFSSPNVRREAEKHGLTEKDFGPVKVIKKSMVDAKISNMKKTNE